MRDKIAAALAGIEYDGHELDPQPHEPRTLHVWHAWVVWVADTPRNRCVIDTEWQVIVLLPPGDSDMWINAGDALKWPIHDELELVGHVERIEPISIISQDFSNAMPALSFTLTTSTGI